MADVEEIEVEDSGPVARRKAGSSTSGWCIMRDKDSHERCPVTIGSFSCACACTGHGSRSGEEPSWIGRDLELALDISED